MSYTLASLLFGLSAWIIPCGLLGKRYPERRAVGIFMSLGCALVCIVIQIFGIRQEAVTGDFAAIDDTIGALSMICGCHAAITLLLNGILLNKI